jgi:hypothetical protein
MNITLVYVGWCYVSTSFTRPSSSERLRGDFFASKATFRESARNTSASLVSGDCRMENVQIRPAEDH